MNKKDEWTDEKYISHIHKLMNDRASYSLYKRNKIGRLYDLYYGQVTQGRWEKYDNLLRMHEEAADEKASTPYVAIDWNSIASRVNTFLGEQSGYKFGFEVHSVNEDAFERKEVVKNQLRYLMQRQAEFQKAAEVTGVEYGVNDNLPKTEKELTEFMDNYRDVHEMLIQEALMDAVRQNDYDNLRKSFLLDLVVTNECYGDPYLDNGDLRIKRINPNYALPDFTASGDYLDDQNSFIYAEYMTREKIVEEFNLDKKDIDAILNPDNENPGDPYLGAEAEQRPSNIFPQIEHYGLFDDKKRILVLRAQWIDHEEVAVKMTLDNHGGVHVHEYTGQFAKDAKLTKKQSEEGGEISKKVRANVRQAVLIGGRIVTQQGLAPDLLRDFTDPLNTTLTKQGLILHYNNKSSVSLVEKIESIQHFKNYVLTLLQKELTTSLGAFAVVDMAALDPDIYPDEGDSTSLDKVLHLLKSYKIVVKNSATGEAPNLNGAKAVEIVDPRQIGLVQTAMETAMMCDREMDRITGINEVRQGQQAAAGQLVGTTQMQMTSSAMVTEPIKQGFAGFEKRLFRKMAALTAWAWVNSPEKYKNIAARLNLVVPEDLDLQIYDVFIDISPITLSTLQRWIEMSVAQGASSGLTFPDGLELLIGAQDNLKLAISKYLKTVRQREEEMKQMQQQEMQTQAQTVQMQEQMQTQREQDLVKLKGEVEAMLLEMKLQSEQTTNAANLAQKERATATSAAINISKLRSDMIKQSQGNGSSK